jgi:hypothetical protein
MQPVRLKVKPTFKTVAGSICGGLFGLAVATGLAIALFVMLRASHQFDRDGKAYIGAVKEIETNTRRGRRGRQIVTHTAHVDGPNGELTMSIDEPVPVGTEVRYIYSPSLDDGRIVAPDVQPGTVFRQDVTSWPILCMACFVLALDWYVIVECREVYGSLSGKYVVVPPNAAAA